VDGIELFNIASVRVTRYRYRGVGIPNPGFDSTTSKRQEPWRARCRETGTAGSASGLGETDREQSRHRAPGRLNHSGRLARIRWVHRNP
jgi:hypothetical protein